MNDARYHRQTLVPQVGPEGQRRLAASRVLLVGCGALGCVTADLLVRAGVGTLTIVDRDVVERTNLQRQTLFDERDAAEGRSKAEAAAARLARINSSVTVRGEVADFSARNAEELVASSLDEGRAEPPSAAAGTGDAESPAPASRLLIDGTDNYLTRYVLNDVAVKHGVPLLYGGAVATTGLTMTIRPGISACLRCLFPDPPEAGTASAESATCDTAGILAPVSTIIGAMQAMEAIKLLAGRADACSDDLVEIDAWSGRVRRVNVRGARSASCPCCGARSFEFLSGRYASAVSVICTRSGGGAVQILPPRRGGARGGGGEESESPDAWRARLHRLEAKLRPHGRFALVGQTLRGELTHEVGDGMHPIELTLFADGRAIVRGTTDAGIARGVYARYVGE